MNKSEQIVTLVAAMFMFLGGVFFSYVPHIAGADYLLYVTILEPLQYIEGVIFVFGLLTVISGALSAWLVLQSGVAAKGHKITKDDFKSFSGKSGGEILLTILTYLTASMGVGMFGAAIVLGGLLFTEQEVTANSRMLNEMIVAGFVSIVSALIMARRLEDERKISRKIPTVADVMATMR